MSKFIKLTGATPRPTGGQPYKALINVEAIEAIYEQTNGSTIGIKSHNNGGYQCRETPAQVLALIDEALK